MAVATVQSQILPTRTLTFGEWVDRQSGRVMVLPAVVILLAFAVFPLIISAYLALSRFALAPGGFTLRFIGLLNFQKLLVGAQQYHFLGTFKPFGPFEWLLLALFAAAVLYWLYRYVTSGFTVLGFIGRLVSASFATGVVRARASPR